MITAPTTDRLVRLNQHTSQSRLYDSGIAHGRDNTPLKYHPLIVPDMETKPRYHSIDTNLDLHTMNLARTSKTFHVVILGGAFAGIRAAQDLENLMLPHMVTITVIERRDRYFYNLGGLRSMAKRELIDIVWLPYDNIFRYSHNRVMQGEVAAVYPNSVILKDGRKLDFDSLLVATGSIYPGPCKIDEVSYKLGMAEQHRYFDMVKLADSILIIGGGPTGVGLAAEIATQYPSKTILLAHSGSRLMSTEHNSETMSRKAHKKLKSLGVKILLNERVIIPENEPVNKTLQSRWLRTSKDRSVFSNLQFLCNGITFDTSFMDTLDPVFRHKIVDVRSRQIRVQPTMQINHPELPWIFAAGDVCNTAGEKQAYRADSQGAHVARCMGRMAHAWAQGTSRWFDVPLKQWHDPAQFMAVAMGPNAGVTDTPWIVLGDLPTRIMKSRELFLARRYKEFNLEFPGTKQKSRSSSASSSTTNISRVTGTAPHAPMYAQNQRRPMRNVVATDLNHKSYGLSKAVAKMAIAAAGSLDNKLDSDRVSLSRPMMRRAPSHNSAYPYSGFYETEQHSETESVQSDEYSSEEEEVGDLNGPARLYAQTAPSNRHTSSSSTTTSSHSMLKSTVSASASVSSASISTSTSGSSASSITPTLLHGPVIPRQQKDRRALGCSAFFQSHVVIAEDADDSAYVAPQKPKAILSHPLLGNKHSGSTATIHLQQYD
ncbi:hypothetical protein GGF47_001408 [Coemansia sp. RSA 2524]|nr:hypothetical protein LPJ54_002576 [Coemansia sp. RSA 1824]KAJ2152533.1 hypothetical protein J3F82_002606 [Coemansia sp. RSA 637]KAJ2406538.1 hypothetical protein J3F80_003373 [Coemansia sp. RSA 2526]KAJ2428298.1 hypothetical protein GGF47_001408 [Coemansia sp. RSA 2524]KAJ2445952.1 hypothetical protein IWW46_001204 [Coemansia sp. RSA 2440]